MILRFSRNAVMLLVILLLVSLFSPLNSIAAINSAVYGWGANWYGQINPPTGLSDAVAISAGGNYSLALKSDGTVIGWGYNGFGQLNIPQGLTNVTAISAGYYHSLALKGDGTVVAWGCGSYGNSGQCNVPSNLSDVTAIAAGMNMSLALLTNKTVIAWGGNWSGQLNIPTGLTDVVAIAAGGDHSLALKSDGTVVGWGYNGSGQITIPTGLSNVIAISANYNNSLALKDNGTVYGWGSYGIGYLNMNGISSNVKAISAGSSHSMFLKNDGTIECQVSIYINYGQCSVPTNITGFKAIAAGSNHSLGLVILDSTPPVTIASATPNANVEGWNNTDVTVTLNASDDAGGSGVASVSYSTDGINFTTLLGSTASVTINLEGITTLSYYGTDKSGNQEAFKTLIVKIDKTAPTISYSGNANTYTVDQIVNITCSTSDDLSGLASSACANINGAAYTFALGTNNFSTSANDKAGNVGNGAINFTLNVDYHSLCTLSKSFSTKWAIDTGLCGTLALSQTAEEHGKTKVRNELLNVYKTIVQAGEKSRALTAQQAAKLTQFANWLQTH
ncbi:MAG: hypothetical protein HXX08_18835 [Chloroflexi bacterium]|uniref:HYR domain-containing protein n=1 Tax=Candidatus Chlorohelix allophototropha TaxID=3003348 RepID=A0A8T7M749_9CHLR|nr:hypothetical protein [Chloroflexota bacterium]WJW69818.1 hypothetical protein OZ401_003448 [Chloroflexota bacterium L227-S17]